MSIELIIRLILMVVIGASIGWITNYIAIKMLFRPYKEINLIFFKIQGLLPKRKHQIGESLAEIIQEELVSLKDIATSIDQEVLEKKIEKTVDIILEEELVEQIKKNFPMLVMFLSNDMLRKINLMIKEAILNNKNKIISIFLNYLEENIDFKGIIVKNVDEFSLEKLEEITYSLAKREFKHIEMIGAILGAIIGFIQFIVGLLV